jgi:hypothetical protein
MGDELSEERPARGFRRKRRRIVLGVAAVTEPAGPAERVQERFVGGECRQGGKESRVRGRADGGVNVPRAAG